MKTAANFEELFGWALDCIELYTQAIGWGPARPVWWTEWLGYHVESVAKMIPARKIIQGFAAREAPQPFKGNPEAPFTRYANSLWLSAKTDLI